ncbi:MAG TPA: IS200/IS605 family transposase [Thermoflexia bacterium]|nr:IS200/IS605 family transposase [Thermoflexia bacterium]
MSYWRLYYHFTWSTKKRMLWIAPAWEKRLYRVIAAKADQLHVLVHAIGGIEDHIHLVVSVPPSIKLATFAGQIKGNSSHFINHELDLDFTFSWQTSYGVVSFGQKRLPLVVEYVRHQREHHSVGTPISLLEQVADDCV